MKYISALILTVALLLCACAAPQSSVESVATPQVLPEGSIDSSSSAEHPTQEDGVDSSPSAPVSIDPELYIKRIYNAPQIGYIVDDINETVHGDVFTGDMNIPRTEISTVGDSVALLDEFWVTGLIPYQADQIRLDVEYLFTQHRHPDIISTSAHTYTSFAAWCMSDDYPDILVVLATYKSDGVLKSVSGLALPLEDGSFHIISPASLSKRAEISSDIFQAVTVPDLTSLADFLSIPGTDTEFLQIITASSQSRSLTFDIDSASGRVSSASDISVRYSVFSEDDISGENETTVLSKNEMVWNALQDRWDSFGYPESFDPVLSKEQLNALIGSDIETVSSALTTLGDVIGYMALSGYKSTNGDIDLIYDNSFWTFNSSPELVFSDNAGNCGGTAGFVAYLLDGDYEESGCLSMTFDIAVGGGHVITYLKAHGTYYVFDPVGMVIEDYGFNGLLSPGSTIVEAGQRWCDAYSPGLVKLMFAYPSSEGDLPSSSAGTIGYLPEQFRDRITIVLEATIDGYYYEWLPMSEQALSDMRTIRDISNIPQAKPGDYMSRVLSDEQLRVLQYADASTIRAWVSTVGDAVALLDLSKQYMYIRLNMDPGMDIDIDFMLGLHCYQVTSSEFYTALTAYFLSDNYPEMEYLFALVIEEGYSEVHHSLLFPSENGWKLICPALHSEREDNGIMGFGEAELESLDSIKSLKPIVQNYHVMIRPTIYQAFTADASQNFISVVAESNSMSFTIGEAREVFKISDLELAAIASAKSEEWNEHAKALKPSSYFNGYPIGNTTLDYASALALVTEEPELIAEQVKTVGDVLQYMIAARFSYDAPDAYTSSYGKWCFCPAGDVQLYQNYGCCSGGYANAVSYLLEGDYEKQGQLRWIGGENHTVNWVYADGKYYIFDFTKLCSNGNYDNYMSDITVLTNLSDYYDVLPDYYSKNPILLMVAFETGSAGYPSYWTENPFTGLIFPREAEGNIITIYQANSLYGAKYVELRYGIPGWNT